MPLTAAQQREAMRRLASWRIAPKRPVACPACGVEGMEIVDRSTRPHAEMNYAYLFKAIDRTGFTGWVGCEYRPRRGTVEGLKWAAACGVGLG
jgi:hypothetical protein